MGPVDGPRVARSARRCAADPRCDPRCGPRAPALRPGGGCVSGRRHAGCRVWGHPDERRSTEQRRGRRRRAAGRRRRPAGAGCDAPGASRRSRSGGYSGRRARRRRLPIVDRGVRHRCTHHRGRERGGRGGSDDGPCRSRPDHRRSEGQELRDRRRRPRPRGQRTDRGTQPGRHRHRGVERQPCEPRGAARVARCLTVGVPNRTRGDCRCCRRRDRPARRCGPGR